MQFRIVFCSEKRIIIIIKIIFDSYLYNKLCYKKTCVRGNSLNPTRREYEEGGIRGAMVIKSQISLKDVMVKKLTF